MFGFTLIPVINEQSVAFENLNFLGCFSFWNVMPRRNCHKQRQLNQEYRLKAICWIQGNKYGNFEKKKESITLSEAGKKNGII